MSDSELDCITLSLDYADPIVSDSELDCITLSLDYADPIVSDSELDCITLSLDYGDPVVSRFTLYHTITRLWRPCSVKIYIVSHYY